jgi:hypothetical protein
VPAATWLLATAILLPAVVAVATFAPLTDAFFLSDDFQLLAIARDEPLLRIAWLVDSDRSAWYRPLVMATWRVAYQLSGLDPVAHRAMQLGLHAATTIAVGWLAWRACASRAAAFVAGAIFAAQPASAGAVGWLSARFDLMATLLVLATLVLCSHARDARRPVPWRIAIALTCWAALASKEVATAAAPVAIALASRRLCRWSGLRERVIGHAEAGVVVAVVAVYFGWRLAEFGGLGGYGVHGLVDRAHALAPLAVLPATVQALLVPPYAGTSQALWLAAGAAMLLAMTVTAPVLAGCAIGSILPFANLVRNGAPLWEYERFLYLPAVWAAIWTGLLVARARPGWLRAVAFGGLAVVWMSNVAFTARRIDAWTEAAALTARVHATMRAAAASVQPGTAVDCRALPDNVRGAYAYRNGCDAQMRLLWPDGSVRAIPSDPFPPPPATFQRTLTLTADGRLR